MPWILSEGLAVGAAAVLTLYTRHVTTHHITGDPAVLMRFLRIVTFVSIYFRLPNTAVFTDIISPTILLLSVAWRVPEAKILRILMRR